MQTRTPILFLLAAFSVGALTGLGCDGGDGDGVNAGKCRQLVRAFCTSAGTCLMADGAARKECEVELAAELRCGETRGVSMTFDQCVTDVREAMCIPRDGIEFPDSCVGVLDTPPTPAQQKCIDLATTTCARIEECTMEPAGEECVAEVVEGIGCLDVVEVGPTYATCMMNLKGTACGALFPGGQLAIPTSCNQVFGTGGGAGGAGGSRGGTGGSTGRGGSGGSSGRLAPALVRPALEKLRGGFGAGDSRPDRLGDSAARLFSPAR